MTARYTIIKSAQYLFAFTTIVMSVLVCMLPTVAAAQDVETSAEYAIIMDSRSGKVLFEKNADELVPPASMSKIMTTIVMTGSTLRVT